MDDSEYVEPWWGPRDPDHLVFINDTTNESAAVLSELAGGVRDDLQVLNNLPTLAVSGAAVDPDAPLPETVYSVMTNDEAVAAWADDLGIPTLRCEVMPTGISFGDDVERRVFALGDSRDAIAYAAERLMTLSYGPGGEDFYLTTAEHRRLEVVVRATLELTVDVSLDPEARALLLAAADTIRAQMATPAPDRTIIGRSLRRVAATAGFLLVGVAANYLTDLMKHFGVHWP